MKSAPGTRLRHTAYLLIFFWLNGCCTAPRPSTCPTPAVVIDCHSHLFTAKYLPIREICISRQVPQLAAEALEIITLFLTGDSHLAENSPRIESRVEIDVRVATLQKYMQIPAVQARQAIIRDLFVPLQLESLLTPAQQNALKLYIRGTREGTETEKMVAPLSPEEIAVAFEKAGFMSDQPVGAQVLRSGGISGYLRFYSIITSSERVIVKSLHQTYPQVSLFVHHMMDLENTYNEKPVFPFDRQVAKMLSLQNENSGKLLTFGAFDPFRRSDALARAKAEYAAGVSGFKFYPPDGYRPSQNQIPPKDLPNTSPEQWEHRYSNIAASSLDQWNEEFFTFCEAKDIPIFVHCTPVGFEAVSGYGQLMADPAYWRSVLERHKKLRVCFGHSGGTGLWFAQGGASRNFGDTVVEMCEKYDNVYCDAGYWETVLSDEGVAVLQKQLSTIVANHPALKQKLVYGTDWFMLSTENKYGEYLCRMVDTFNAPGLKEMKGDFFAGNAARYLKLAQLASDPRLSRTLNSELKMLVERVSQKPK